MMPGSDTEQVAPPTGDVPVGAGSGGTGRFEIHLDNFDGPFDLLLSLISAHRLDVTEVALSVVTDEFLAYIKAAGVGWDLGQATEFLVVAATLVDLKAARLLPRADVEDEEDIALLEARDLLFARLLQYRAYKEAAAYLSERFESAGRRFGRQVQLEPRFAAALPEVLLGVGPDRFALIAAEAMTPREPPTVSVDHVHTPRISVREQAVVLAGMLTERGTASFAALTADCASTLEVIARFLALLELFRETVILFDQEAALGELHVRWVGDEAPEHLADDSSAPGQEMTTDMDEEYA